MRNRQLPPFRHYKETIVPFGSNLVKAVAMILNDRTTAEDLAKKGDVITEQDVLEWAQSFLPFELDVKELSNLSCDLNIIRVTVFPEDAIFGFYDIEVPFQRTEKSISQLKADLPKIIDFLQKCGGFVAPVSTTVFAELLKSILGAEAHLRMTGSRWGDQQRATGRTARWHADVRYVATILEGAAARAGNHRLSFTKATAPAVKFINRALQRAGVQIGSPDAIAREMARYKSDQKKKLQSRPERSDNPK
jgi:hypothetical protein